jgi:hypothetical protein
LNCLRFIATIIIGSINDLCLFWSSIWNTFANDAICICNGAKA